MKSRWFTVLNILIALTAAGLSAKEVTYQKGETWTYEVKGARPWTSDNVYGDRTLSVNASEESGYTFDEEWGSYDDNPHTLTINKEGFQTKLLISDNFSIDYEKPVPFYLIDLLKVDEEKDFGAFSRETDQFSMSYATQVKREKNEDVTVPAGEFKDCQHYVFSHEIKFGGDQGEIKRKMERHIWVHPKVNGNVKEEYRFQPFGGESEEMSTTTVLLKKHEVKSE